MIAVSGIGCGGDDKPSDPTPDPVLAAFPVDFETSYTMVRDCRTTFEHGLGLNIQVWADPGSVQNYLDNEPFEVGSVLVKTIIDGEDCATGSLRSYSVMIKGPAGTDPDHNDWLWQEVRADRTVERDGLLRECASCHSACADRDYACTDE